MNVLKLFGIDRISPKIIITAIGTLMLFGVATNGLFELWKLFPTLFIEGPLFPDWGSILLDLFPFFSFCIWISYIYIKLKPIVSQQPTDKRTPYFVTPHRGIILSLSKPQKSPRDIIELIKGTDISDISSLYNEWSIGQLFKGLYYHKDVLKYVWPLTTRDSLPYCECIGEFLKKFIPSTEICGRKGSDNICHLTEGGDLELIEKTKSILSAIYSNDTLSEIGLQKSDIIVDITGGTKSITIGLIFGALDSAIDIQYVEQQSKKYDVIPLAITPEIILDKTGEYLLELYSKMNEIRRKAI
jgi:hypothetical protein